MSAPSSQMWMGGIYATDCIEITNDADRLDDGSFWSVAISFEGEARFARFANVTKSEFPMQSWNPLVGDWSSSLSQSQYIEYVEEIRRDISTGGVYQVNACRELVLDNPTSSLGGLFSQILTRNPAPFSFYLCLDDIEIASASPERFLTRDGEVVRTSPIKGTIRGDGNQFGEKDKAENLMIVDLMRNDLGQICKPGTVEVIELFRHEKHPGITHLVSDVQGVLKTGITWREVLRATMPPGSISGAPKSSALEIIRKHEGMRGPYCGTLGWIQGDRAELSVAIRTFWNSGDGKLRFGTGAGITWGSNAHQEWEETQLKAHHLLAIAGGRI